MTALAHSFQYRTDRDRQQEVRFGPFANALGNGGCFADIVL
jgi:hypothetical protein